MDIYSKTADLITPLRIKILREMRVEKHPEELANKFKITRQGVDKHLSILYQAGLIDKKIKDMKRPMVFYSLTSEGENFLQDFEKIAEELIMSLRKRYKEELFALDHMLVGGEISENEYRNRKRKLDERFDWVIER